MSGDLPELTQSSPAHTQEEIERASSPAQSQEDIERASSEGVHSDADSLVIEEDGPTDNPFDPSEY